MLSKRKQDSNESKIYMPNSTHKEVTFDPEDKVIVIAEN